MTPLSPQAAAVDLEIMAAGRRRGRRVLRGPETEKIVALDDLPAPSADQLLRHATKFGPEAVRETARALGVNLKDTGVKRSTAPNRRRTGVRDEVRALLERGMAAGPIASALNISDRRCKALVAEIQGAR